MCSRAEKDGGCRGCGACPRATVHARVASGSRCGTRYLLPCVTFGHQVSPSGDRPAPPAHASSRRVSRRSGGGRPGPIATDHRPLTSCRQRADQATAHARAVPGHVAARFRADDGKDGMHSRAAACKAAQFTLVHQCSHSDIVGHMEDAFVSSEFMCVNRGGSHTV